MARENEEQRSLREYGNRKKRHRRRRNTIIIMMLLAVAAVGVMYLIRLYNRNYHSYEVVHTTEVTGKNAVGYLSYGSSVIKYSNDGAVAIDQDGKQLWNGSYEMANPIADTCGNYTVVADKGSKSIHIFNQKGVAGSFETIYDIVKVEVARQGVVAVLMEDGDSNYIQVLDLDGTELWVKKTSVNKEGFPLDISLSDNGQKLIASYLTVTDGKLIDNVSCFNFSEVGKNKKDNFVGGWKAEEGIIVPRVAFANNDTISIFKNNGLKIGSMPEIPSILEELNFEEKIQSILYNKKYIGVVLEAAEGEAKHLLLYNLKGKKVLDKSINFDYKKIFLAEEEIIFTNDTSCIIMKVSGKVKFKGTFEEKIEAVYPINNLDRYFLISGNKISQILLKE